jgi:hypothetical protein
MAELGSLVYCFQGILIAVRVVRAIGLLGALQVKGSSEGFLYLPEATGVLAWQRFSDINAKRSLALRRQNKWPKLARLPILGNQHLLLNQFNKNSPCDFPQLL